MAFLLVRGNHNHLLPDSPNPSLSKRCWRVIAFGIFAVLLTLSIVVSLKIIGALLVEGTVVVPAAAARNVAGSTRSYLV